MSERFVPVWCGCAALLLAAYTAAGLSWHDRAHALRSARDEADAEARALAGAALLQGDRAAGARDEFDAEIASARWRRGLRDCADRLVKAGRERLQKKADEQRQATAEGLRRWAATRPGLASGDAETVARDVGAALDFWAEGRGELAAAVDVACQAVPAGTAEAEYEKPLAEAAARAEADEVAALAKEAEAQLALGKKRLLGAAEEGVGRALVLVIATDHLGADPAWAEQLSKLSAGHPGWFTRSSIQVVGRAKAARWSPGAALEAPAGGGFRCAEFKEAFDRALDVRKKALGARRKEVPTLLLWPSDLNPNDESVLRRDRVDVPDDEAPVHLAWLGAGEAPSAYLRTYFHKRVTLVRQGQADGLAAELAKVLAGHVQGAGAKP